MQRIAITGVGGFIGRALAARALTRGDAVVGLDLSEDAALRARAEGVDAFVGNVCSTDDCERLCRGADVVLHTAAILEEGGAIERFRAINVGGTQNMLRAAQDAGVRRFVQLSSVMVYGFDYPPFVTEDGPLRGDGNPYCQTKIESERVVSEAHTPGGLETIIIRPGDVYGVGSQPWIERPLALMRQGLFILPDGGQGLLNHVYIDNLVDGIFLALDQDATGEAFNLTDGKATLLSDFYAHLAPLAGRRRVTTAPSWLLRPLFRAVDATCRLLRRPSPAHPDALRFVQRSEQVSIEKARRQLGYEPRISLEEGLARVIEGLAEG